MRARTAIPGAATARGRGRRRIAALALCWCCAPAARAQAAAAPPAPADATLGEELGHGFYSRYNVFGYGVYNGLSKPQSDLNLLDIPRSEYELDLRPDFSLTFRQLELGLKPRLAMTHTETDAAFGDRYDRSDSRHRWYLNEAYVRYRFGDRLTAVYARENLQWGPASLLSASNPFNPNNGKNNPNIELPGLDYVRLVAIPGPAWTLSLIANTGSGRYGKDDAYSPAANTGALGVAVSIIGLATRFVDTLTGKPLASPVFQKTYAAKLDYTGEGRYFSVIASYREHDAGRLGAFGGWDASDALLLYGEGSVASTVPLSRDQPRDIRLLAGAAYTLAGGATVTAEYFSNHAGCLRAPVILCAATAWVQPQLPLLRRRYELLQYVDTKIGGNTNVLLRLIRDADDRSYQASVNIEYELGEHWQLYLTPTLSNGSVGSEFGTLPKRAVFLGASYTF
ncbi:hypothetical protein [Rugamonas sp.]|uniref:hypothetical protein n=1 Tax=Rugamonas sp. TaxID=1926287 RepID=UPI0025E6D1A0|nr:hypothetical protein [Rugamonas sp.]